MKLKIAFACALISGNAFAQQMPQTASVPVPNCPSGMVCLTREKFQAFVKSMQLQALSQEYGNGVQQEVQQQLTEKSAEK